MDRSLKRSSTGPTVKSKPMVCKSEPKLTVVTNGHHKPIHRNNNSAHTSGAPYQKLSRPHSIIGTSALASSPDDMDLLSMINGKDDLYVGSSTSGMSSYRSSSDIFSATTSSSRPFSLSNSRTNSSESFDPENFQAFDFDLIGGSVDYNDMNSFGDNWLESATSPTSPNFSTTGSLNRGYVTSPNFVDDFSCHSTANELPNIPEYDTYPTPSSNHTRESGSQSPSALVTPVQTSMDQSRLSAQQNSYLDRWASSSASDMELLSTVETNYSTTSSSSHLGHSRNLSDSSAESAFTSAMIDSMVANDPTVSGGLEMSLSSMSQIDMTSVSPNYIDMERSYNWL
jgi:hypothetical protein